MRWLAIHLPDLPLEVFARARAAEAPLAVCVHRRGERILRCNTAAMRAGIGPGQGVGAARARCAELTIMPRRPAAEQEALEHLAAWSIRFTPQVSLAPPRALLLDVAASLRLFGGADALLAQVSGGISARGYQGRFAMAPTPLGALVWARQLGASAGTASWPMIPDLDALHAALDGLPLAALGLSARECEDLTALGLRRVADVLRLPRPGLRERLGSKRVDWLERLLGETPDPRPTFVPPPRFSARIELPAEVDLAESLVFPCRRLLGELAGFLRGRQAGVPRLDWRFGHAGRAATCFSLGAAQPLADPERWLELLRGQLERMELPAPVREIALAATAVLPLSPRSGELFPELARPGCRPDPALLDRLRARLGRDAVRGLALAADHRPERAWRWSEPGETGGGSARLDRPLWLLPQPVPLEERDGKPWLDGALDLGAERERIDTGWWDDCAVARDYFIATNGRGERLWVYRELRGRRGWYLHGRFD
ncbi:Y-family DNA polymerase [Lamprocystis purpurea]|jgi:protein ImuB|uniref:Y-family DNA polymerase n=1 Tax=Lamprocystis purpurea TaxID=61598 RepID=UPI00037030D1|nr:DNA polymerase Y family protein [Lamprocystis purpurea]